MRFIVDCGPMCDEITYTEEAAAPSQELPSTSPAAQYINGEQRPPLQILMGLPLRSMPAFFEDYYTSYPIVERGVLEVLLERYAGHGPRSLSPYEQSILYLVMAIGASSRSVVRGNGSVNPEHLYALAWGLFPHVIAAPGLVSVQILLLHVRYPHRRQEYISTLCLKCDRRFCTTFTGASGA